jgi:hypothetical protein
MPPKERGRSPASLLQLDANGNKSKDDQRQRKRKCTNHNF